MGQWADRKGREAASAFTPFSAALHALQGPSTGSFRPADWPFSNQASASTRDQTFLTLGARPAEIISSARSRRSLIVSLFIFVFLSFVVDYAPCLQAAANTVRNGGGRR